MTSLRIAVVGAGTAGLAAAALLSPRHRVTVFERVPQPAAVGAGLLLQPTGLQVLQHMGLASTLMRVGQRIDRLHGTLRDREGRSGWPVMDMRYADLGEGVHGLGMSRHALFGVLLAAAQRGGADILPGVAIDDATQHGDGIGLRTEGRDLGRFDLCIVANGSFSALRDTLRIAHRADPYPWGALWALLPDASGRAGVLRQWYRGAHQMLGLMPTGWHDEAQRREPPWTSLFWSVRAERLDALTAQPIGHWKQQVRALTPEAEPYLDIIDDWSKLAYARYADVHLPCPHVGRAVFIGDCAHAMSPQLGQGANMALIDAWVLAHELHTHAADVPRALAAYARQRHAHLAFYRRASRWLTPLFQSDAVVPAWLRNAAFWPASRLPLLRTQALDTLTGRKAGWLFGRLALPESPVGDPSPASALNPPPAGSTSTLPQ